MEAWNFKELSKDATFYVNENGQLVIVFNEGEVAPMYMGVCEFTIPSDVTEDIVKSDYLSRFHQDEGSGRLQPQPDHPGLHRRDRRPV